MTYVPISLTGLSASDVVPGQYIEINFGMGNASLGGGTYSAVLLGNVNRTQRSYAKTAGIGIDNTLYGPDTVPALSNEDDAISLFGNGSELHLMYREFVTVNPNTPVYAVVIPENVGAVAATSGTWLRGLKAMVAGRNGVCRLFCNGEFIEVSYAKDETLQVFLTRLGDAINATQRWPIWCDYAQCTISTENDGFQLVIKATQGGTRGNRIMIGVQTTQGSWYTDYPYPAFDGWNYLTGGTGADSNTTALNVILPRRFYYIVSAANDSTQFGALATQVASQAMPTIGVRQRCFCGSNDTPANAMTLAQAINNPRAEVISLKNCDKPPASMAAAWAAAIALFEAPLSFKCNYDFFGNDTKTQPSWRIKAPFSGGVPTRAQIKAMLDGGVTPIACNLNGTTYVVSRITSKSLNGNIPDYRIRDAHKVTVCDRYSDDLSAKFALQFTGKKIADDPPKGARVPSNDVVTPRVAKVAINKLTDDYDSLELLQNVETIKANTQVQRALSPTTRLECRIPLETIDLLHQSAFAIDQIA